MKYLKSIATILLCAFVFAGCDAQNDTKPVDNTSLEDNAGVVEQAKDDSDLDITEDNVFMEDMTIGQIVMDSKKFSILESALEQATMLEMSQRGSYTLLAPTDDAWNNILDVGDYEAWFTNHDKPLSTILKYHVIKNPVTAADLADGLTYSSVLGSPLNFDVENDGEINVNDHEVEYVIHASNGIIYVMSEVLMPEDISNDLFE